MKTKYLIFVLICILSYSIVQAQNEPVGIKATITGDGHGLILTYNKVTKAMKIRSNNNSKDMFMDREGWLYMEDKEGPAEYQKMNLKGIMGMSSSDLMGPNMNFSPLQDVIQNNVVPLTVSEGVLDAYEESESAATSTVTFEELFDTENNSNFFLPMIEWGMRFKVSQFENNSNFRSELVNCNQPVPCRQFIGTKYDVQGVRATFNPDGRVRKITYQGSAITYEYGNYNVVLPEATEFKLPFNLNFDTDGIPNPDN